MPRPQQSTQIYDENVHGAGARRTRYGTRSQSSKIRGTGQRRALGDISNQERKAQSGKNVQKRVGLHPRRPWRPCAGGGREA